MKAGTGASGQFYAFYFYAGWLETRDLGAHWYPITRGTLSNMQAPFLLTDPLDPNHLYLGGDQGLYETCDYGSHWIHIPAIQGNVLSIVGTDTTPRIYYCATDQGFYYWREEGSHITQITHLPMSGTMTRLATDGTGKALYGLSGRDLWFSSRQIAERPGNTAGTLTGGILFHLLSTHRTLATSTPGSSCLPKSYTARMVEVPGKH